MVKWQSVVFSFHSIKTEKYTTDRTKKNCRIGRKGGTKWLMLNYAHGKVALVWRAWWKMVGSCMRTWVWLLADGLMCVCVCVQFFVVPTTQGTKRSPGALKPLCFAIKDASDKWLVKPLSLHSHTVNTNKTMSLISFFFLINFIPIDIWHSTFRNPMYALYVSSAYV